MAKDKAPQWYPLRGNTKSGFKITAITSQVIEGAYRRKDGTFEVDCNIKTNQAERIFPVTSKITLDPKRINRWRLEVRTPSKGRIITTLSWGKDILRYEGNDPTYLYYNLWRAKNDTFRALYFITVDTDGHTTIEGLDLPLAGDTLYYGDLRIIYDGNPHCAGGEEVIKESLPLQVSETFRDIDTLASLIYETYCVAIEKSYIPQRKRK